MRNTTLAILAFGLILQAPVQAAEEYTDTVPVELAQIMLGNNRDARFLKGLPEDFPIQEVPDKVEVVGSMESNNQQRVIFRSERSFTSLSMALSQQLVSAGWQAIPNPRPQMPMVGGGFISTGGGVSSLCHDELGNISFSQVNNQMGNQSSALVQLYFNRMMGVSNSNMCQQRIDAMRGSMNANVLRQYMPVLSLPDALLQEGAVLSQQGSSGSGNSYETRATLAAALPIGDILTEFNVQLEDQGWSVDSKDAGEITANSIWIKEVEVPNGEVVSLIGMLTVIEQEEYSFSMNFQVSNRDTGSNGQGMIMGAQRGFFSR